MIRRGLIGVAAILEPGHQLGVGVAAGARLGDVGRIHRRRRLVDVLDPVPPVAGDAGFFEDRANVDNDIVVAGVRVILVVEDSIRFYSAFLAAHSSCGIWAA